jgi:hypothetical protein
MTEAITCLQDVPAWSAEPREEGPLYVHDTLSQLTLQEFQLGHLQSWAQRHVKTGWSEVDRANIY